MERQVVKVKTLKTLYLDHFDNEWSEDNPKMWCSNYWYKCGPEFDYEVLRKGSILTFYREDDEDQHLMVSNKMICNVGKDFDELIGNWFKVITV